MYIYIHDYTHTHVYIQYTLPSLVVGLDDDLQLRKLAERKAEATQVYSPNQRRQ